MRSKALINLANHEGSDESTTSGRRFIIRQRKCTVSSCSSSLPLSRSSTPTSPNISILRHAAPSQFDTFTGSFFIKNPIQQHRSQPASRFLAFHPTFQCNFHKWVSSTYLSSFFVGYVSYCTDHEYFILSNAKNVLICAVFFPTDLVVYIFLSSCTSNIHVFDPYSTTLHRKHLTRFFSSARYSFYLSSILFFL